MGLLVDTRGEKYKTIQRDRRFGRLAVPSGPRWPCCLSEEKGEVRPELGDGEKWRNKMSRSTGDRDVNHVPFWLTLKSQHQKFLENWEEGALP